MLKGTLLRLVPALGLSAGLALATTVALAEPFETDIATHLQGGPDQYYLATRCAGFYKTVFVAAGGASSQSEVSVRARGMLEWTFAAAVQARVLEGVPMAEASDAAMADVNAFHDQYVEDIQRQNAQTGEPFSPLFRADQRVCAALEEQRAASGG